MATPVSDIISINISLSATAVAQANFGIPLILANATFPERVRYYTSASALAADGTAGAAAQAAGAKAFGQDPSLERLAVGRMSVAPTLAWDFTPVAANSQLYTIVVNGQNASFTSDASATVAEITAGLTSAVNALAISGVTATDGTTKVTVAGTNGLWFTAESLMPRNLMAVLDAMSNNVAVTAAASGDLDACLLESPLWYAVTTPYTNVNLITHASTGLAVWCQNNKKFGCFLSADTNCATLSIGSDSGTSTAGILKTSNTERSALMFHHRPSQQAQAAWLGDTFPLDPGSLTFMFRKLSSVDATNLTGTELINLRAKNANYNSETGGVNITAEGKMASGQFMDVTRDVDWLKARLESRLFFQFANHDKIPFTDAGIQIIVGELRGTFAEAKANGVLSDDTTPVIVFPRASEVPALDRAARNLTGISASDRLAGAIHKTTVQVNITA